MGTFVHPITAWCRNIAVLWTYHGLALCINSIFSDWGEDVQSVWAAVPCNTEKMSPHHVTLSWSEQRIGHNIAISNIENTLFYRAGL